MGNGRIKADVPSGALTYHGKPHAVCGTTEKYTKGSSCVSCSRQTMLARYRGSPAGLAARIRGVIANGESF